MSAAFRRWVAVAGTVSSVALSGWPCCERRCLLEIGAHGGHALSRGVDDLPREQGGGRGELLRGGDDAGGGVVVKAG